ncbi:SPARC-related modular calcium-binding protein 1, partial [Eschrichtius robustus]|nr:SPARC-related modular calcium-binding protein 1 [Eschrichtius robustus]
MEAVLCDQLSSIQPALSSPVGGLEGSGFGPCFCSFWVPSIRVSPCPEDSGLALSCCVWAWESVHTHGHSCISCQLAGQPAPAPALPSQETSAGPTLKTVRRFYPWAKGYCDVEQPCGPRLSCGCWNLPEKVHSCDQERQSALEEARQNPREGIVIPECAPGGLYKPVQCHQSTGYCWCVLVDTGRPLPGTSTRYVMPSCDSDARAKSAEVDDPFKDRELPGCPEGKKMEFITSLLDALTTDMVQAINSAAPTGGG